MSIKGNAESNILRGRISDPERIHGKSAYEIDVMHGYDGTEEEWLKEVRGDFDDRVAEAKAEFNAEVDNVIVPEAKAELESAKTTAIENAVAEIADAETNSLKVIGQLTSESTEALEKAASVLDESEVLLWENENIAEPFVSQDIIISDKVSDKIKHFRLVSFDLVGTTTGDGVIQSNVLPSIEIERGQQGIIECEQGTRMFSVFNNGNIRFEGATSNASCIPYRIYGVKNKEVQLTSAYIRYSANADGTDFTEGWSEGQNYIGFATGATAPTDKSEYEWVKISNSEGSGINPELLDLLNYVFGFSSDLLETKNNIDLQTYGTLSCYSDKNFSLYTGGEMSMQSDYKSFTIGNNCFGGIQIGDGVCSWRTYCDPILLTVGDNGDGLRVEEGTITVIASGGADEVTLGYTEFSALYDLAQKYINNEI